MNKAVRVEGDLVKQASGEAASVEAVELRVWSVLVGGRSFDVYYKDGLAIIDGRAFAVEVYDPREMPDDGPAGGPTGRRDLLAPMPGKVIRVLVEVGDDVEAGQGIVVVEAMKMQNEIPAPKRGRVAAVGVKAGDAVSTGQMLAAVE